MKVAGARRSSSASRRGRKRGGRPVRTVRGVRANRLRIQVRVFMRNLLPGDGGLRYTGRTTSRARRPCARALLGRFDRLLGGAASPAALLLASGSRSSGFGSPGGSAEVPSNCLGPAALLAFHFLPEVGRRLAVDDLQRRQ